MNPIWVGIFRGFWLSVGLIGLAAGLGLFWHKNWARRTGMVFAGILEILSLGAIFISSALRYPGPYHDSFYIGAMLTGTGIPVFLLATWLLVILGGERLAASTHAVIARPVALWPIFAGYLSTGIGIIPALIMLENKPAARAWAQGYAIVLLVALPIAGVIVTLNIQLFDKWGDAYFYAYLLGQIIDVINFLFLEALAFWALRTLRKPEIRAYYENGQN